MSDIPLFGKMTVLDDVPEGIEYVNGRKKSRIVFKLSEPVFSKPAENIERYSFNVSVGKKQGILELNYRFKFDGADVISNCSAFYRGPAPKYYKFKTGTTDKTVALVQSYEDGKLDGHDNLYFF